MKEENNNTNVTDNERTNPEIKLLNRDNDKNTYKLWKILNRGEKPRWVTVGEDGIIINKNPTKEELKSAKNWLFKHNSTETHEDWGKIDAKGSSLLLTKDGYLCHQFHINKNKKADFFFCVGYDKERKHVKTVFIIPNEEYISELDAIAISYNGYSKYNIFKESEKEVKKWDDLFHMLKLDNCPVLRRN